MSELKRKLIWPLVLIFVATSATIAIVVGSVNSAVGDRRDERTMALNKSLEPAVTQASDRTGPRNLALQPEALKLSRRLGRRFWDPQRTISIASGTVTVGVTSQVVQLVRRQTDRGERIEIVIGVGPTSLTWNESDGSKSSGQTANDIERMVIERLTFDSPDQLVLAQLRGASYYTVARNVRPAQADENYEGALWDIIRVDDPDQDEQRRAQSRWRLYYVNSNTGLVDKVVSEIQGERIEATFSGWRDQEGEKSPTHIVWTRQGETLMELYLLIFSFTAAQ